jgi:hypothetical protein
MQLVNRAVLHSTPMTPPILTDQSIQLRAVFWECFSDLWDLSILAEGLTTGEQIPMSCFERRTKECHNALQHA